MRRHPLKDMMAPQEESARPVTEYGPASEPPARFQAKNPVPFVLEVFANTVHPEGTLCEIDGW
jgi:hypothetical protein